VTGLDKCGRRLYLKGDVPKRILICERIIMGVRPRTKAAKKRRVRRKEERRLKKKHGLVSNVHR
jgi:hypothetical protein